MILKLIICRLNEGFTRYLERLIISDIQGEDESNLIAMCEIIVHVTIIILIIIILDYMYYTGHVHVMRLIED